MIKFVLDPKTGIPYYRQIIDQIKYGIASGNLKAGEKLPTVRALAFELKMNTVTKAYKELEIQNILDTQPGTGTFISKKGVEITSKEKKKKLKGICNEFLTVAYSYGFTLEDLLAELQKSRAK